MSHQRLQQADAEFAHSYSSADGRVTMEHRGGTGWMDAPIPPRLHRCKTQTRGYTNYFTRIERCACGAISINSQRWRGRNSRRERKYPRPLALIAFLALLLIVGIASAAVVKADPENASEVAFIAVLDQEGITYPNADYALKAGYQVCDARHQGMTEIDIAEAIFNNSKLTSHQSGYFVGAAEAAFCPEMISAFEKRVGA